jgi:hypothetical protein
MSADAVEVSYEALRCAVMVDDAGLDVAAERRNPKDA